MNNFLTGKLKLVTADVGVDPIVCNQPIFFQYWRDQVNVLQEPTIFLHEKFVKAGGTPSLHTWAAVGYDLLTWLQWCQLTEIDWKDATESDRAQFADDYGAAQTEDKTINRKLTTVRRFYDFARVEGWYLRDIGSPLEARFVTNRPIDEDSLAHTRSPAERVSDKDRLLRKVGRKDVIRPLQVAQLRKLLEHVGPTAQDEGDSRLVRDRLICDLAYMGGARLGDVTSLTTLKFLSITVEPNQLLQDFPLIVEGKGKVTRKVAAPGWLVVAVQEYITGERATSALEGKKRGTKTTTALFLGHASSKSAGKPISHSAVQKMFALACMKCGITEQIEVEDLTTGEKHIKTVPAHSLHDLRHNCAVLTYHAELAEGNPEPWKPVQLKLGHKRLKDTIETYLAHVEIFGMKEGITDTRRLIGLKA